MSDKAIVPSEAQRQIDSLVQLLQEYETYEIKTLDDCEHAASVLIDVKSRSKALEERRKEITKPLDDAKASVMNLFRPAVDGFSKLERILKPKIRKYHDEIERQRKEEEAKALEKARKEREKLEKQAEKAREKGQEEKADMLESRACSVVAQPTADIPKIGGVQTRGRWVAEVTNVRAMCLAIANGELPEMLVSFKQVELNKIASAWKNTREFDGLKIYKDKTIVTK